MNKTIMYVITVAPTNDLSIGVPCVLTGNIRNRDSATEIEVRFIKAHTDTPYCTQSIGWVDCLDLMTPDGDYTDEREILSWIEIHIGHLEE